MSELDPAKQYKTTGNLAKRGDFNARYGTFSWFVWLADLVEPPTGHVLDIGCGPGWFWKSVAGRWTPQKLTLADVSPGMLEAAQTRLSDHFNLETVCCDVDHMPFADDSFDHVIAMHMLYHSKDPARALSEIARVLKPGAQAIITTVNDADLSVMADLSRAVFGSSGTDLIMPVFGAARGMELLAKTALEVTHHPCKDVFEVDDTDAALDYITSFPPGITADATSRGAFRHRFEAMRQAGGGHVQMARLQDLFIARKPDA